MPTKSTKKLSKKVVFSKKKMTPVQRREAAINWRRSFKKAAKGEAKKKGLTGEKAKVYVRKQIRGHEEMHKKAGFRQKSKAGVTKQKSIKMKTRRK